VILYDSRPTPIDESNFYRREVAADTSGQEDPGAAVLQHRHTYVSFLYSIGASSGFISKQTGDSIKTLETDYAKYIKDADSRRDFVEAEIQRSATLL